MAANKSEFVVSAKDKLRTVWYWPTLPNANYTKEERKDFRRLSEYFSSTAGIAIGTVTAVASCPVWITIGASAVGVIGGHYLAGVVSKLRHDR